jgi:hypothetical protein
VPAQGKECFSTGRASSATDQSRSPPILEDYLTYCTCTSSRIRGVYRKSRYRLFCRPTTTIVQRASPYGLLYQYSRRADIGSSAGTRSYEEVAKLCTVPVQSGYRYTQSYAQP